MFSLNSDDGSQLWIDKGLIVDNDGHIEMQERQGARSMNPGIQPITIEYHQIEHHAGCIFSYSGPDSGNQMVVVPQSALRKEFKWEHNFHGGLRESIYYFMQGEACADLDGIKP